MYLSSGSIHCEPESSKSCSNLTYNIVLYGLTLLSPYRVILVALGFRCFAIWVLALPLLFSFVTTLSPYSTTDVHFNGEKH
jgi:hypothetical protein